MTIMTFDLVVPTRVKTQAQAIQPKMGLVLAHAAALCVAKLCVANIWQWATHVVERYPVLTRITKGKVWREF